MPTVKKNDAADRRVISILVDNQRGVLARVSSLFNRRGFNIDSLTTVERCVDHQRPQHQPHYRHHPRRRKFHQPAAAPDRPSGSHPPDL